MPHTKDNKTKVIDNSEMNKRRETKQNRKTHILLICIGVALAVFLVVFFAVGGYEKILDFLGIERDVSVTPTVTYVEAEIKGNILLAGKNGTTIVYDEQGVTGYGTDGKWKWHEMCSVSNPAFSDCGEFAVVADVGGTAAYAFDENGIVWKYGSGNVIKSVFGKGKFICIIHEENEYLSAATIYEYDSKTSSIQELFTRKFSTHYMLTGAISNNGKQMVLSGVFSDGGVASGIISFIKMADGEIFSGEVTENNTYVKTFYASDDSVFAVNSDSVRVFYKEMSVSSGKDRENVLWNRNSKQDSVVNASLLNDKYILIAIGNENADKSTVKAFDTSGKESLNLEIEGNIIGMDSEGETFMVYTDSHAYLYNSKGLLIGKVEAGFKIAHAVCTDSRHIGICGEGKLLTASFE